MLDSAQPPAAPTDGADDLLIRANRLDILERLADDLAHEIKNPLHSMVINLEVLKRRVARSLPDDEDALRYLGVLGSELDRVTRRIELLLRLARPGRVGDGGSLEQTVEELLELIQLEGRRHGVEIRFDPDPFPRRLTLPREPVRQALLDILLDLLERAERGGSIRLRSVGSGTAAGLALQLFAPDGVPTAIDGVSSPRLEIARHLAERLGGHLGDSTLDGTGALLLTFPGATA